MNIRLLIKKLDKFVDSSDIKILNDILLLSKKVYVTINLQVIAKKFTKEGNQMFNQINKNWVIGRTGRCTNIQEITLKF